MMHRRFVTALAVLGTVAVAAGCGSSGSGGSDDGDGPIKIGSIEDISGPIAPYGRAIVNGTELAIEETNADGGLLDGRRVELQSEDGASDKATMPTLMRKLGGGDAAAIIGPTSSSALVVGAPLARSLEVPLIAPTSSEEFDDGVLNDWTFRVAPVESIAFEDLFGQMQERIGFRRVALFYDEANNASVSERRLLEEHQDSLGYELVAVEASPEGRTDVSSPVSKIAAARPDVVFVAHLVPESAALMKQLRARGVDVPFVGGAPFATTQIFEIAGAAGEGALTFVPFIATSDDPRVRSFVRAYEDRFGTPPDQFAALGYDTTNVVLAAIEEARSAGRTEIRDALGRLSGVDGVTGTISYEGGPDNATPELVLVEVRDGRFVPVE